MGGIYMRMYDVIDKKKRGGTLTKEEIYFFVSGYVSGEIPDYQASALMMAIWFNGMNKEETADLTLAMAYSGDRIDLSKIPGTKLDKHSTGGIGDKTTLIIGPILASLGVKVAKMSGRGLGATGGTIDKLDSIPGFSSEMSDEDFIRRVMDVGMVDAAQTGNLVPADKKMYALRDVTATVDSIPLIASSIMSKKLASGADSIILDVKCGSGAFMRDYDSAKALADAMTEIGERCGRHVYAFITDMNEPLGHCVGNSLEVLEAVEVLRGEGEERLTKLCLELSKCMLIMSDVMGRGDYRDKDLRDKAEEMILDAIKSGKALDKFREFVRSQGGDDSFVNDPMKLKQPKFAKDVKVCESGYLVSCNAEEVGNVSCVLGAGRLTKSDSIDSSAGIRLYKKLGDKVEDGEVIATLYTDKEDELSEAEERFLKAYTISENKIEPGPVIL
jgi:pyrimidine-nucleoside phosphorylase